MTTPDHYVELAEMIMAERKKSDRYIDDVLAHLDWHEHVFQRRSKPWVTCRDRVGNLYTIYPNESIDLNTFVVVRECVAGPTMR